MYYTGNSLKMEREIYPNTDISVEIFFPLMCLKFSNLFFKIGILLSWQIHRDLGYVIPFEKTLSWKKHKLESRLPGEMSVTSDMQMTPPLWHKVKKN